MVVNVVRKTLKDINNSMERYSDVTSKPHLSEFKLIKLVNGDDILCKILEEYSDALIVDLPLIIRKQDIILPSGKRGGGETRTVEHVGLDRWMKYSKDMESVIYKDKILSFGDLATEVVVYYKMISSRIREEMTMTESLAENTNEAELNARMEKIAEVLQEAANLEDSEEDIDFGPPNNVPKILH